MIGERLTELRTERGLSLRSLARQTELSATLLSQVERGVTEPSLATLRKLGGVFGKSVAELFREERVPDVSISRPGERFALTAPKGEVQYERLSPGNGQLELLRSVIEPGQVSSRDLVSHPVCESTYVVRGCLTVEFEDEAHLVQDGECITLDGKRAHRYANRGDVATEIIMVVNPPFP